MFDISPQLWYNIAKPIIKDAIFMNEYSRKFLVKMPDRPDKQSGNEYKLKFYKNEKKAAILESNGETYGFDVIAEITGNSFYSDEAIFARDERLLTFETERKWLVKIPSCIADFPCHTIEQAYLDPQKGFQGRIRKWDDRYIYTEKARIGSSMTRIENEREISGEEYEQLSRHIILNVIKKRRYIIPCGGLKFELDVFENNADTDCGLMEAELPDENTAVRLPDFVRIIREVTDDPYYTNRNLASLDKIKLLK